MATAYVGIGSNLEPGVNINKALTLLNAEYEHLQASPVYLCAAQGYPPNVKVADYLNLVVQFETSQTAGELTTQLKLFEQQLGRVKGLKAYAPKVIDLDLLLLEPKPLGGENYLPHPDILTCAYILLPLSQLFPDGIHPHKLQSYQQLWDTLKHKNINLIETLL